MLTVAQVDAYLERIRYEGSREPTAATLAALHRAHLLSVPFENLDIRLGRPIALDTASLFDKIVARRRGGFCYELNGLFGELLRSLGFAVEMLSGRVWDAGRPGPEFDHMLLRVELDPVRLADVGFGDSFRRPPPLAAGEWAEDGRSYRLETEDGEWILAQRDRGADWAPQVSFTTTARAMAEFAPMCRHHATAPESSFVRRAVATRATPDGRVTISDGRLIETTGDRRTERPIAGPEELASLLTERLGLEPGPGADFERLLPPFDPPAGR